MEVKTALAVDAVVVAVAAVVVAVVVLVLRFYQI